MRRTNVCIGGLYKKSKGFTLIELLAVIVILAIIALIATPIVLNIIKDSKESATLQSAQFYLNAVETSVAQKIIDDPTFKPESCEIQKDGNLKCNKIDINIEINGEVPTSGTITLEQGKITDMSLVLTGKTLIKDGDKLLQPGLYDSKGKLIITWDELVNDYEIDIQKNYSEPPNPSKPGEIIMSNEGLSKGVKLVIDSSITTIGNYAFHNCTNLKEIIIPNSVISIGAAAFRGCTFSQIMIPSSVTDIGVLAFGSCKNLKEIIIPNSVINIGSGAFSACTSLIEVTLPKSIANIEAFSGCTSLTKIIIPNSVTSIGANAFNGCKSLKEIIIPNSVTSISINAFEACPSLTEITLPNSITNIANYAFGAHLRIINYMGTEKEWNSISLGEFWDDRILNKYTLNYNYRVQ